MQSEGVEQKTSAFQDEGTSQAQALPRSADHQGSIMGSIPASIHRPGASAFSPMRNMASKEVDPSTPVSNRANRPNALADINYGSIIASDPGTPSEDEDGHKDGPAYSTEDVEQAISVSIGQEQTRLTSQKTPAAEKAAAMEDLEGGALFDSALLPLDGAHDESPPRPDQTRFVQENQRPTINTQVSAVSKRNQAGPERLPSPWRAEPRRFSRLDTTRNTLRDTFNAGRRRTLSGTFTSDAIKKFMDHMPSMPKSGSMLNFNLPSFSNTWSIDGRPWSSDRPAASRRSPSGDDVAVPQHDGGVQSRPGLDPSQFSTQRNILVEEPLQMQSLDAVAENGLGSDRPAPSRIKRPPLRVGPPSLRRSTSLDSFIFTRTISRASSLGDDTRFDNIQEQVNSRFKAIKDSLQDANFKLPSMPSMPSIPSRPTFELFGEKRNSSRSMEPGARGSTNSQSRSPRPESTFATMASSHYQGSSSGMDPAQAAAHPYFTRALGELKGDVVVMGGYRGSVLRSAEPPHRQLWVPIKVGLNIRKVDLEVGLDPEDEENMEQTIIPSGMLKNIGPVDISRRLFKRLRHCENAKTRALRVHDYGYDWRLSPHILSRKLIQFLEGLPCNQLGVPAAERGATVIAHSLGGLITRHAVNQRPELFAGVVYAGVPTRCVNILGPLRNGDDVLFSSRVLTAQVNFSIRTSFALLPLDGECFIDRTTKEHYPVDFFDPNNWIKYHLSPCINQALPAATPPSTSISGLISSMASVLPSLPTSIARKNSNPKINPDNPSTAEALASTRLQSAEAKAASAGANHMQPHMNDRSHSSSGPTACTIPFPTAIAYLTRTLAETKSFKLATSFIPAHAENNIYPPVAVIYGKSTPTVYGAKVDSREGIKRTTAYDELAFASGDGVVLARAAQLPEGYRVARGGVVSSERGHVTLLGDLEAVGRCLVAVLRERRNGVGLGSEG